MTTARKVAVSSDYDQGVADGEIRVKLENHEGRIKALEDGKSKPTGWSAIIAGMIDARILLLAVFLVFIVAALAMLLLPLLTRRAREPVALGA